MLYRHDDNVGTAASRLQMLADIHHAVKRLKAEGHPGSEGCHRSWNGLSQQGRLRGPWPFMEDKQCLRCRYLFRVPVEVTGR